MLVAVWLGALLISLALPRIASRAIERASSAVDSWIHSVDAALSIAPADATSWNDSAKATRIATAALVRSPPTQTLHMNGTDALAFDADVARGHADDARALSEVLQSFCASLSAPLKRVGDGAAR